MLGRRAMRQSFLAIFLFCSLPVFADPIETAAAQGYTRLRLKQQAVANAHRPWVWEARRGEVTIWLAGCLHLGMEGDPAAYPHYLPYYQKAERVYFEIAPGGMDTFEVRRLYQRRGYLKNGQSLEEVLPGDLWAEMRRTLGTKPQLLTKLSGMEPWQAAFQLTHLNYERAGLARNFALEAFLIQQSSRDRKPVGGLEMAKDQILAFADSPPGEQNAFLRASLRGYASGDRTALAVRKAWMEGNEADLRKQLDGNRPREDSNLHHSLIAARNQKWVERLQEISEKTKQTLIVVGIEHLVTDEADLPTLLGKQGYTVRRLEKN